MRSLDETLVILENTVREKTGTNAAGDVFFEMWRPDARHRHIAVSSPTLLARLARRLITEGWSLAALTANDEHALESKAFKFYFLFQPAAGDAGAEDAFLMLELMLAANPDGSSPSFSLASLASEDDWIYYARDAWCCQLRPYIDEVDAYLHPSDPAAEAPYPEIREPDGIPSYSRVVVGPVHAGIIEPGRFTFHLTGKTVVELDIHLGYKRRGVEAFLSRTPGLGAWGVATNLVGRIVGDSAAAYEIAWCRAVEAMADVRVTMQDATFRAILLELERMVHHMGDTAALARDVAFEVPATRIFVLRERMRELFRQWFGHRWLWGRLRIGGMRQEPSGAFWSDWRDTDLPSDSREKMIPMVLEDILTEYTSFARPIWENEHIRDRMQRLAWVPPGAASRWAACGPMARSSGVRRDFRLDHPWGPYKEMDIADAVRRVFPVENPSDKEESPPAKGEIPIPPLVSTRYEGDTLARLAIRYNETLTSWRVLRLLAHRLHASKGKQDEVAPDDAMVEELIRRAEPHAYHLGHAEGWRGDVICFVMKGEDDGIFRVKFRDPSQIGWRLMEWALPNQRAERPVAKKPWDQDDLAIGDFPVVNKSFNLSYCGNDL